MAFCNPNQLSLKASFVYTLRSVIRSVLEYNDLMNSKSVLDASLTSS